MCYEWFIEAFLIRTVCQVTFVRLSLGHLLSFQNKVTKNVRENIPYWSRCTSRCHSPLSLFYVLTLACKTGLSSLVCFPFGNKISVPDVHHSPINDRKPVNHCVLWKVLTAARYLHYKSKHILDWQENTVSVYTKCQVNYLRCPREHLPHPLKVCA